jgi:mannose-6-phosphate isomerase-like protein (cupin superfamily)
MQDKRPVTPAFDPADVPESNFTSYPEPHRAVNQNRYNRRLGVPGGQSSYRHAHSHQDEFIFVLKGEVVLETNGGSQR